MRLYDEIINLLQNFNCERFRYEIKSRLDNCIHKSMYNDLLDEIAALIKCGAVYEAVEQEILPKDITDIYNRCGQLYSNRSRIYSLIKNANEKGLDIKIGSLQKVKSRLYTIGAKEINDLKTSIKEEHVDEAYANMLASIVFEKVPWIKPVTFRYALELLNKESISAFREWFWSSIDELLLSDSGEKANRIIHKIEKGVNEILNAKDLKYRLERYGKITLMLTLPLSFASVLVPSTSIIGLGASLLSTIPEIIWYIEKNRINRKYSWLMPDIIT